MEQAPMAFRERLRHRCRVWWETDTEGVHGTGECHALRRADDPEELWRCCVYWQRKLSNKWNAREFATRHGCRPPGLYWSGRDAESIPFGELPAEYVIRLTSGFSGKQVFVMREGTNLVDGSAYSEEALKGRLADLLASAFSETLLLVEEFARDPSDPQRLPVDYRFHMFGNTVAMILCSRGLHDYAYYADDWSIFPFQVQIKPKKPIDYPKPEGFDQLLRTARTLACAYGTYVRVDLYWTEEGPVFGEFAPHPCAGKCYSPEADAYFERHWREHFPDRV